MSSSSGSEGNGSPEVLPKLTPIEGLEHLGDPLDLLTPEQRQKLQDDLAEMARCRRRAEAAAANWPLP